MPLRLIAAAPFALLAALTLSACAGQSGGQSGGQSAGQSADQSARESAAAASIGLFTSLPILWSEAEDLGALLNSRESPHWALGVLRESGAVRPLDALAAPDGTSLLGVPGLLVMAQPRPLSPQENVALDRWVRGGGRVLLFADPMLTADSEYALGDRRRPQDVVLLSPILTRWRLSLEFDDAQPAGERLVPVLGEVAPVNLPGRLSTLSRHQCTVTDDGLVARCRIGKGRVLAVADAAVLEAGSADDRTRRAGILRRLLAAAR